MQAAPSKATASLPHLSYLDMSGIGSEIERVHQEMMAGVAAKAEEAVARVLRGVMSYSHHRNSHCVSKNLDRVCDILNRRARGETQADDLFTTVVLWLVSHHGKDAAKAEPCPEVKAEPCPGRGMEFEAALPEFPPGIRRAPSGRFRVRLRRSGKEKYLGTYDTLEEAQAVLYAATDADLPKRPGRKRKGG